MAKLVLDDLANLNNTANTISKINANNAKVEQALEKTLSRDGTSPNQMGANLDMNGYRVTNLPAPQNDSEPLRKGDVSSLTGLVGYALDAANDAAAAAAASAEGAASSATSAATSASGAASSATAAATSATNAATSETNAATSATDAAASAAAAAALAGAAASAITVTPAGTIAATNVQAALEEVAAEAVQLADTSSFGQSLIAAADAAAGRNLLGIASAIDFNSGTAYPKTADFTVDKDTDQGKYFIVDCTTVEVITLPDMSTAEAGWSCIFNFQNAPVVNFGTKLVAGGTDKFYDGNSTTTITEFYTPGLGEILGFVWTGTVWIHDLVKNSARSLHYVRPTTYASSSATAPSTTGWQSLTGVNYSSVVTWMASGSGGMSFIPRCSGLYELEFNCQFASVGGATTSFNAGVALGASSSGTDYGQIYQYYPLNSGYRYETLRRTIRFSGSETSAPVFGNIYFDNVGGRYSPSTVALRATWLGR